jgi:hypothetical protein
MIGTRSSGLLLPTHRHKSHDPDFTEYFYSQNITTETHAHNSLKHELEDNNTRNDIIFQEQSSHDATTLVLAAATMEKLMDWLLLSEGMLVSNNNPIDGDFIEDFLMTFPMFSISSKSMELAETIFQSVGFNAHSYYEANEDLYDCYLHDDDNRDESVESKRQKRRYFYFLIIL